LFYIKVGWETGQIKKLVAVGESKGFIVPKTWLDLQRRMYGAPLKEVVIAVSDMMIVISPVVPTKASESQK
jgi:hypothetical protein